MSFKQKKVRYFSKQYLIIWVLLFSVQALRCSKSTSKVTIGGKKELAFNIIKYPLESFKTTLENQADLSKINGDILHTVVIRKDFPKLQVVLNRINTDLKEKFLNGYPNTDFPNAFNKDGYTPFMVAIKNKDDKIVEELIKYDFIKMNAKDNTKGGITPLHLFADRWIFKSTAKNFNKVSFIINNFLSKLTTDDIFEKNLKGRTAFYYAAYKNNRTVFMALLDNIKANLGSSRNMLSQRLKEALLSKDEKGISVLCCILFSKFFKDISKEGIAMFQEAIPKIKSILTDSDFKNFSNDLTAEIDNLYNTGKIKDCDYSTLSNVLSIINPIEVNVTHNHNLA